MPIYEYRCASCGHELEALQKLSEAPLSVCPSCHKAELRKCVSVAGFQLKGSGWYVTDFRNNGVKQSTKDASGKAAASANGAEAKPAKSGDVSAGETASTATQTRSSDSNTESKTTVSTPSAKTDA
jgi:putative FmdB family regulatory protein